MKAIRSFYRELRLKRWMLLSIAALGGGIVLLWNREDKNLAKDRAVQANQSARANPPLSLRAILATKSSDRSRHWREWVTSLKGSQFAGALLEVERISDDELRAEILRTLMNEWLKQDLPAAIRSLSDRALKSQVPDGTRNEMCRALACREPAEVLEAFKNSLPIDARREWYGSYFMERGAIDSHSAIGDLLKLVQSDPRDSAMWTGLISEVALSLIDADSTNAAGVLSTLPAGSAKSKVEIQVAYRWTELDPAGAANYAAQQDNPQLQQTVAAKWAEQNPQAAVSWAASLSKDGTDSQLLATASAIWAQTDPQAAATYAKKLSESPARQQVYQAIATSWAMTNPEELERWLGGLADSQSRNSAVNAFCSALVGTAPERAFEWAEAISDATMREQNLEQAAAAWMRTDPISAKRSIEKSSLDLSVRSRLMAGINP